MDLDILQFYKTHIEQLPLAQRLKLLELLMQSTIEAIRREKELEPTGSQAEETFLFKLAARYRYKIPMSQQA